MKNILNRKNLFTTQSAALLGIIAGILLIANLISANHFGRLDLTAEKQYSISPTTRQVLKNLDDLLTIKIYFTTKLPPDLAQISQYVKDILGEYKAFSPKINIEVIDPAKDEQTRNEILSLGIPEVEMQILDKDEFKVQKGFLGLALFYGAKTETVPFIQNSQNLEYDLTSAIKRLTAKELKTVGFLTGHDEHGIYDLPQASQAKNTTADYTTIAKALAKNYNLTLVDLAKDSSLEKVDTLIIAGPKKALTEKELWQIDQFIMKGGKAIFLLDEVNVEQGLQAKTSQTGLEKLLLAYGIQVNQDLAADTSNENVGFNSGYVQFFMPYPFWPKLIRNNFEQNNPIMAKLQTISLPWASSLEIASKPDVNVTALASTTKNAAVYGQPFNLDPQQQFNPTQRKQSAMILLAQGKFTSAYAGQATPKDKSNSSPAINQAEKDSQIIAMADSDFISDNYLQRFPDNAAFFLNATDYLTMGSDLISIRAKALTDRPLQKTEESSKTGIKIFNIIAIPLLIIIAGVVRFYQRRKK